MIDHRGNRCARSKARDLKLLGAGAGVGEILESRGEI
jgi:hypothetical protein